jgi:hypothetical protein
VRLIEYAPKWCIIAQAQSPADPPDPFFKRTWAPPAVFCTFAAGKLAGMEPAMIALSLRAPWSARTPHFI